MTIELMNNKPKRRDKLVIMMEIIGIAKKGETKTHIMLKANLSFSQLNEYIESLTQNNLLQTTIDEERIVYKATKKGLEFMERQQQIICMLDENSCKNNFKIWVPYCINSLPKNKPLMFST